MEFDKPITIAIILFIILVLSFYLVLPKYYEFQNLLTELGKKQAEFSAKSAYFIEVTRVHKELMLYKDDLEKIDTALPQKFSFSKILSFLNKKSSESGLILQSASVNKAAVVGAGTGIKEAKLSLQILGSYTSLEKFISSIENSARLIEGENVSFSIATPTVDNPVPSQSYPITLSIKVYSY
jgi:Tfp pilus assembly protein PilO